jgi:hypothetical protein
LHGQANHDQGAGVSSSRRASETPRTHAGGPGIPGSETADEAAIPPEFGRASALLAFAMNRFIVDHIIRSARLFGNDTETPILFGMLAHLNVVHLVPPGSDPTTTRDHHGRVPDAQPKLRPVRVRDLAQITGRPRETVRRKLEQMRKQGRVRRLPDGWVYDASAVDADMKALTMGAMRRFLETADVMRSLLKDAATAVRKEARAPAGPVRRRVRK